LTVPQDIEEYRGSCDARGPWESKKRQQPNHHQPGFTHQRKEKFLETHSLEVLAEFFDVYFTFFYHALH